MKKAFLAALTAFLVAAPAAAADGVIDVRSDFSVQETTARVENLLNEKGMTIFKRINHSEGAGKVGIDLRETVLILFGNPKVGSPLMKCRQSVALDLPQKALIWEDGDGQTWISYNDPAYLGKRHDIGGCDEVLDKIGKALGAIAGAAAMKEGGS